MSRRRQMDDFMVGGSRGPSARNRPDPNAGRRPGDPYIIAQDSRPVYDEGLSDSEFQQFQDFLNVSGRGAKIANRFDLEDRTQKRQAEKLARMQFDQFRNLQRGGDYAPSLKPGMRVPGGTIQRVPQEGGLAGFLGRGGFLGNFLADLGGNAPRTIRPVDSGPSGRRARGSFNINTGRSSAINPEVGRRDVLSRMITERPSANIPAGGIMNNFPIMDNLIETRPASFDELSDKPASPTVTAQPGGTIAGPAPATTFAETGMDTPFLGPIAEGTGDFSTTRTADTVDDFEKLLAETLVTQAAAQSAARDTDQQLAAANTRALVADAVANQRAKDAERAAALDLVNQAASDEARRQAALDALFTEAGLENMVGDGPMLELPPGTDPIDDFDMLTLGTTPMPPADSPYTEKLEEIFTERDLGNMSFNESVDRDVIEPAVALMSSRLTPGSAPLPLPTGGVDFDTMPFFESSFLVDRPMDRFVDPDAVNARARLNQNARRAGVGMGGRGRITSRVPLRVSPSYFGDLS